MSEQADEAPWHVYIVRSASGALYTGISTDPERRLEEHRAGRGRGARFFRLDPAESIVWSEPAADRSEASRRERVIKKWSRDQKLALVRGSA